MKIAISSDHAGNVLRGVIRDWLVEEGYAVTDLGPGPGESVDYPDRARPLAEGVASGRFDRGVLICGTGQGMAMTANRVPGVRAAVVADTFSARMAMAHNDARVLCLGERVVGAGVALDCVEAWLNAEFEGGRHARRVEKIG
ncbi:MAG: ribose 5-phosphate isomerase B [Alphaproteobacteria bacterium]|nr:ribose 5-phosphate isomerase B [Alphaproteobacteria bacterium]